MSWTLPAILSTLISDHLHFQVVSTSPGIVPCYPSIGKTHDQNSSLQLPVIPSCLTLIIISEGSKEKSDARCSWPSTQAGPGSHCSFQCLCKQQSLWGCEKCSCPSALSPPQRELLLQEGRALGLHVTSHFSQFFVNPAASLPFVINFLLHLNCRDYGN